MRQEALEKNEILHLGQGHHSDAMERNDA